jgi:glycosyltransferase involved in cell wall biosynthesis
MVCNQSGANIELINLNNGLLYTKNSFKDLANKIISIINDSEKYYEFSKNAKNFAVKNFSNQKYIDIFKYYSRVLRNEQ